MKEKRHLQADTDKFTIICRGCGKKFYKNNSLQIVFFCSPSCRTRFRRTIKHDRD